MGHVESLDSKADSASGCFLTSTFQSQLEYKKRHAKQDRFHQRFTTRMFLPVVGQDFPALSISYSFLLLVMTFYSLLALHSSTLCLQGTKSFVGTLFTAELPGRQPQSHGKFAVGTYAYVASFPQIRFHFLFCCPGEQAQTTEIPKYLSDFPDPGEM